jgi:hypothetical protein
MRKDLREYISSRKNLLFSGTLLSLCAMVLCATYYLPSLIDALLQNAAHMISDADTITTTLAAFFPDTLAANMGVLASDIAIFFGIVAILSTYNLISKEIKSGRWIFPLSVGYQPFILIFSKGIIYGLGAAFPAAVFYNLYYFVGSMFLTPDYGMSVALVNSLILGFAVFSAVYITIILASIYKRAIMSAATMILFVAVAPDIFALFSFGKFLPTHLLTHIYQSGSNATDVIIPAVLTAIIAVILTVISSRKASNIEITR